MLAVTGATGFVGRALCVALEQSGLAARPLGRTAGPGRIGVGDIGSHTQWRDALQDVSTVIHLAARVHQMREGLADPLAVYRETNVAGTLHLARAAHAAGVKRLVFVSSIKVNGERTVAGRPFRPDDVVARSDPYGMSKHEAELGLWALAAEIGLEIVIVRPPLVYGAGVGANFRALVSLVRRRVPLPLASIRNRRSLIAVENLADLLIRCATDPRAPGGTFLCSDGQDLSTPDLLRAIGRASGVNVHLMPAPVWMLQGTGTLLGQGGAIRRLTESLQVDMSLTRDTLGWTPPLTVIEAMTRAAAEGWGGREFRPSGP